MKMMNATSWIARSQPLMPRSAIGASGAGTWVVGRGSWDRTAFPRPTSHVPRPALNEQNDDRDDEGVDRDGLGQTGADDQGCPDVAGRLRVAPKRFHRAADGHTDAQARTDRPDADGDTGAD